MAKGRVGARLAKGWRVSLHPPIFGDKFGESLGGSQATPSFWEVPGLPRKFPKLPRKFFGDFPGSSLTVELYSNPGVPRKFPRLPRKFPGLPRKFPGLPQRSALSLGSLTPSPDSQKLSLKLYCNSHSTRLEEGVCDSMVSPCAPAESRAPSSPFLEVKYYGVVF